jgi:hypothetical protein
MTRKENVERSREILYHTYPSYKLYNKESYT